VLGHRQTDVLQAKQAAHYIGWTSQTTPSDKAGAITGCKNPAQVLKNISTLKRLTPAEFDQWERNLRDNLSLVPEATPRQMATITRLSVSEHIRDILDSLNDEERNDIDRMVDHLREIVKPNKQGVKFKELVSVMNTRQKPGQSTQELVFDLEKNLTKLKQSGVPMDAQVAALLSAYLIPTTET